MRRSAAVDVEFPEGVAVLGGAQGAVDANVAALNSWKVSLIHLAVSAVREANGNKTQSSVTPQMDCVEPRSTSSHWGSAWEAGGKTCSCNAGPRCRHHHRQKQAHGWQVAQHLPGYHTWTTPSGRQYTTGPTTYPI